MNAFIKGTFIGASVRDGKTKEGLDYVSRVITIIPKNEIRTVSVKFDSQGDFQNFTKNIEAGKEVTIPVSITAFNSNIYFKFFPAGV